MKHDEQVADMTGQLHIYSSAIEGVAGALAIADEKHVDISELLGNAITDAFSQCGSISDDHRIAIGYRIGCELRALFMRLQSESLGSVVQLIEPKPRKAANAKTK
ncbi:MAG TPA: hypothetical protein VGE52_08170 [Pirellulales bacterium]